MSYSVTVDLARIGKGLSMLVNLLEDNGIDVPGMVQSQGDIDVDLFSAIGVLLV